MECVDSVDSVYIVSRHRTLDRDYLATEEKATGSNRQCWAGLVWAGLVVDRNQSEFGGKLKCPTQHQHTNHRHFLTSKIKVESLQILTLFVS